MNQNSQNFPLYELLDVFQNIDSRIIELHQNSSNVFLQLNDFLKDYFKKNTIVSSNATKIFDTIAGSNDSGIISELTDIFNEFQLYREGTDSELNGNLQLYNRLNTYVDNLSLLLRNYKQDLITLKFLVTNYRVIPHSDTADNSSLTLTEAWEPIISKVYPHLTNIGSELSSISNCLASLDQKTRSYINNSVKNNSGFYDELNSSVSLINNKNLESKNYIPVLKEKIASSSESIGNIITHLQYHDIIRQKIEHIQKSHQKIISSLKEDESNHDRIIKDGNDELTSVVADISGLQAAQLILISKEYQNALEVIYDNFQKIAEDLTTVSNISHEFSYETENSEITLIKLLKERLDKSLMILDEYNSNSFNQDLLKIKQQVISLHQNLEDNILCPLKKIKDIPLTLKKAKSFKINEDSELSIEEQISALSSDILHKSKELENEISLMLSVTENFQVESDPDGFRSRLEKEQIRIMVSISRTLGNLDEESKQLDNVLGQNYSIKKDIITRLKETLNRADYYELFEKVLNKIIEQLNAVNNQLKKDFKDKDKGGKIKNLKDIEVNYTVASERIVHQKVLNEEPDIEIPESTNNEEDLELF